MSKTNTNNSTNTTATTTAATSTAAKTAAATTAAANTATKVAAAVNTYWMAWAKAAAIRAVKTFFQVFASLITVDGLATGLEDINWIRLASVAAVSGVYSIATSFAGLPEVNKVLGESGSSNNGDTGSTDSNGTDVG